MSLIKDILEKGIFIKWHWFFGEKPKLEEKEKEEIKEVKKPQDVPGIM